ncbi:MAG: exodeoxyribonuclease VII small subunit [Bacteroidales bacterium]|nr:exodeoxyribonuclease VII small subunit [Bacteroidales bacterium]
MTTKKLTYKEALQELEEIMLKFENEELDVDDLISNVKRSAELIKYCKDKLHETDREIEQIIKDIGAPEE